MSQTSNHGSDLEFDFEVLRVSGLFVPTVFDHGAGVLVGSLRTGQSLWEVRRGGKVHGESSDRILFPPSQANRKFV